MKVILLSGCYPRPSNLNSGIFVHQQVKALQTLGVECHVIQPVNWFPPFGLHRLHPYWKLGYEQLHDSFSNYEGVPIHHPRVFVKMPSRFFRDHYWDLEGAAVAEYILTNRDLRDAKILYAQFLIHEGYVGVVVKERTGIPLVSIALGDDVHAWPEEEAEKIPFLKKVLYHSDLLLANSKRLSHDTEAWADKDYPVHVNTIYQGIDLEKFQPLSKPQTINEIRIKFGLELLVNYILCVATPVRLKGWTNLLDSIQSLGEVFNGWKLLMVAPRRNAPDALDLEKEVENRNIGNSVKYLGKVDHHEIPDLMRAVDAFVLPSYNEGLSNAVLEAMATGLPVVTTDVGGHREFITDHRNGLLVKPNNTARLTEALRKIIVDPELREQLALQARSGALHIGSYKSNAEKLISAFRSLKGCNTQNDV